MVDVDASEGELGAALHGEGVADLDVVLEVAVDLNAAVDDLTHYFYLLAETFCSPSVGCSIRYISLPDKIVQLLRIIWKHIIPTYQPRQIFIYLHN